MATAAMRFGHTLINGFFTLVKDNGETDRSNNLTKLFFDIDIVYQDGRLLRVTVDVYSVRQFLNIALYYVDL